MLPTEAGGVVRITGVLTGLMRQLGFAVSELELFGCVWQGHQSRSHCSGNTCMGHNTWAIFLGVADSFLLLPFTHAS